MKKSSYQLYVLLALHVSNQAAENTGWRADYKDIPMLFTERDSITFALACSSTWKKRSVRFVGVSDGFTNVSQRFVMEWAYDRADRVT